MRTVAGNNTEKLRVFAHQIYECKKGVRSMALCTLPKCCIETAVRKLDSNGLAYFISQISPNRYNVFFGEPLCVAVAETVCSKPLNKLTPEEDFILGTMLGYSIKEQCRRYSKQIAEVE